MVTSNWLQTRAQRTLQALMATAPWALERLRPFAGQILEVRLGHHSFSLKITPEGALSPYTTKSDQPPALTLAIPLEILSDALLNKENLLNHLHLSGNSALAVEIGFLAQHFRPDLEELLSHWFGDIIAHRLGRFWHSTRNWLRDSVRRNRQMFREYAQEEAKLLPTRAQMNRFANHLGDLNDELNRLEQRLAQLS
ncbi:MAG: hypothetical protein M0Z78_06895 [Betaproteobacteria bacterium]|nr:hypothetical protein [Betaproteobacteria bacterium]